MNFIGTSIQVVLYVVFGRLGQEFAGLDINMWMLTVILIQVIINSNRIQELDK